MPVACITGASSGIGREFAIQLSKKGYDLILISRNINKLNKLASTLNCTCDIIQCDLSDETACLETAEKLSKMKIDLLINNAGFGDVGSFYTSTTEKNIDMIKVNIIALQIMTQKLLPEFIKKDHGYILNVASCAGFFPGGPYMATYYATKNYVVSLTNAIHQELKEMKSNVHISMLCPGPVNTNFNNTANVSNALPGISAKKCVKYAIKKMEKDKTIIIPSFSIKLAVLGIRFIPQNIMLKLTSNQQKKKQKHIL